MRNAMKFSTVMAMIATASAANAQASSTCLTHDEARALFAYAIPQAIEGVAKVCKPSLPATAFLPSQSAAMVARLRGAGTANWASAKTAFLKMGGKDAAKTLATMPDSALEPFVAAAFSSVATQDIKPTDCGKIDRFVAALAPLPPGNAAELITSLIALVGGKDENMQLCPETM